MFLPVLFLHQVILTNRFILTTLSCKEIQSKLVYSNRLFATKNGKKEPIVKTMKINTKCEFLLIKKQIIGRNNCLDCTQTKEPVFVFSRPPPYPRTAALASPVIVRILNKNSSIT